MKRRFTYKELTLVIGIVVAIIIWLTVRFTSAPMIPPPPTTSKGTLPGKTSEVVQHLIKKAVSEIALSFEHL